jgi:hypothetical protein
MKILRLFFLALCFNTLQAQNVNFDFILKDKQIAGLGGIQSFAYGIHDEKWIIFGGRLDGLHRRQPFASFDIAGHNNQIFLVDPVKDIIVKRSLSELPAKIKEPLSSTNMQFHQDGEMLYLIGGYGYSVLQQNHNTFNTLTAVNLRILYEALLNNKELSTAFRQIENAKLQVTGGYLGKIGDTFYLVGGQKFIGRYNPMGPNNGPGFIQEYTNAIRKFKITDQNNQISITDFNEIIDPALLHKRDYNMAHQIMPDGTEGLTAFSGVFRPDADLPFLNCVNITTDHYAEQPDFLQLYNHYHCAHFTMYSEAFNEMHTVFFGGIAQYYEEGGLRIKDDNVPFVNTIATVYRDADGKMTEKILSSKMPGLLGAGSEFIPIKTHSLFNNEVIKYDRLSGDTIMVGYIVGGIRSTAKNIFFVNDGTQSIASPTIFEVYLIKSNSSSLSDFEKTGTISSLEIFPNPARDQITVKYNLHTRSDILLTVHDESGKELFSQIIRNADTGPQVYKMGLDTLTGNKFLLTLTDGKNKISGAFLKL